MHSERLWIFGARAITIMFAITSFAQAATPVISTATINTTTNTLNIVGANLLGASSAGVYSVTLGSIALTVLNQTPISITASFPAASPASSLGPGMYPLTVDFFGSAGPASVSFEVTVSTQTRLLFSFVTNINGFDTDVIISNISLDPTIGSPSTPGACVLNFINVGSPPTVVSTPTIPGGGIYAFSVSGTATGFNGYLIALCNFKAQGVAFLLNGATVVAANPAVVNP